MNSTASDIQGTLYVAISSSFDYRHIRPLIADFAEQHPGLSVEFDVCIDCVEKIRHGYDVVILPRLPDNASLVTRKLTTVSQMLCASPGYLVERPAPLVPEDIYRHRCLVRECDGAFANRWEMTKDGHRETIEITPCLSTSSSYAIKEWVTDGLGIAAMSRHEIWSELARGLLVPVLEDYELAPLEIYLVYAERTLLPAKTRSFVDYIAGRFGR